MRCLYRPDRGTDLEFEEFVLQTMKTPVIAKGGDAFRRLSDPGRGAIKREVKRLRLELELWWDEIFHIRQFNKELDSQLMARKAQDSKVSITDDKPQRAPQPKEPQQKMTDDATTLATDDVLGNQDLKTNLKEKPQQVNNGYGAAGGNNFQQREDVPKHYKDCGSGGYDYQYTDYGAVADYKDKKNETGGCEAGVDDYKYKGYGAVDDKFQHNGAVPKHYKGCGSGSYDYQFKRFGSDGNYKGYGAATAGDDDEYQYKGHGAGADYQEETYAADNIYQYKGYGAAVGDDYQYKGYGADDDYQDRPYGAGGVYLYKGCGAGGVYLYKGYEAVNVDLYKGDGAAKVDLYKGYGAGGDYHCK